MGVIPETRPTFAIKARRVAVGIGLSVGLFVWHQLPHLKAQLLALRLRESKASESQAISEVRRCLSTPEELDAFIRLENTQRWHDGVPCLAAMEAAITMLSDRGEDRCAELLVLAAADPGLHWSGESAEHLAWAITRVGKPCLPFLRRHALGKRTRFLCEMADAIDRGLILE